MCTSSLMFNSIYYRFYQISPLCILSAILSSLNVKKIAKGCTKDR